MKTFLNRFVITWYNEWNGLFNKFNWYTFTPINIAFEYERYLEGISLEFIILGLGFHLRFNLPASDAIFKKFEEEVKKTVKKTLKQPKFTKK